LIIKKWFNCKWEGYYGRKVIKDTLGHNWELYSQHNTLGHRVLGIHILPLPILMGERKNRNLFGKEGGHPLLYMRFFPLEGKEFQFHNKIPDNIKEKAQKKKKYN
jgi:hypothetical protein